MMKNACEGCVRGVACVFDQQIDGQDSKTSGTVKTVCGEWLSYLISRLADRAVEASEEAHQAPSDLFQSGRNLAYFEVLDILKTELEVAELEPSEFGIAIDPYKLL